MLLRTVLKDKSGNYLLGIGTTCMAISVFMTTLGRPLLECRPDAISVPIYFVAAVLAGLSVVLNVTGLRRCRAERSQ